MKLKSIYLLLPFFLACSSVSVPEATKVTKVAEAKLSAIVLKSSSTAGLCPASQIGEPCLVTYKQALSHCRAQASHLPTAREYADWLQTRGVQVLEKKEVNGSAPKDFYLVDCKNEDGTLDGFYLNHTQYQRPANLVRNHLLWTSSSPPGHLEYAHVYYDEWGGGGGNPQDHLKTRRNAFQCAR